MSENTQTGKLALLSRSRDRDILVATLKKLAVGLCISGSLLACHNSCPLDGHPRFLHVDILDAGGNPLPVGEYEIALDIDGASTAFTASLLLEGESYRVDCLAACVQELDVDGSLVRITLDPEGLTFEGDDTTLDTVGIDVTSRGQALGGESFQPSYRYEDPGEDVCAERVMATEDLRLD